MRSRSVSSFSQDAKLTDQVIDFASRDARDPVQQGGKIVGRHFNIAILGLTEGSTSMFQFVDICIDVRFQ